MKFFMGRMGVNASHSFHGLDPQVAVVGIWSIVKCEFKLSF